MAKKAFVSLTGGLNNVDRPDTLEEDQLQECVNYEITGVGKLEKRTDPSQYSSELTEKLDLYFEEVLFVSEPYYPPNKVKGDFDDFILFIYGIEKDTGEYRLEVAIPATETKHRGIGIRRTTTTAKVWRLKDHEGNSWVEDLYDAGLKYTSESEIDISIGDRNAYISDGVNAIHKITVDNRGRIVSSFAGLKAPKNKPRLSLEEYNRQVDSNETETVYTSDVSGTTLGGIGLLQAQYTVVLETGEESNPSPASDFINGQFFKIADDGLSDERLIKSITVRDLNVPQLPANLRKNLKYFKIYYRIIRYSEGVELDSMEFSTQVDIKKKTTDNINTGNDYTISAIKASGSVISYENDAGIPCKVSAVNSGIVMIGSVVKSAVIPGDFRYMTPITVKNLNDTNYVDAVVQISLDSDKIIDEDGNRIFKDWSYYFHTSAAKETASYHGIEWANVRYNNAPFNSLNYHAKHLRIYDNDLTTPIMVYVPYTYTSKIRETGQDTSSVLEIYVKIPLLPAASDHTLYFCWNDVSNPGEYDGVEDDYNKISFYSDVLKRAGQTGHSSPTGSEIDSEDHYLWENNIGIHYGRWCLSGDLKNVAQSRQQVFQGRRVPSGSTEILSVPHVDSMGLGDEDVTLYDLPNRANLNNNGEGTSIDDPLIVQHSIAPPSNSPYGKVLDKTYVFGGVWVNTSTTSTTDSAGNVTTTTTLGGWVENAAQPFIDIDTYAFELNKTDDNEDIIGESGGSRGLAPITTLDSTGEDLDNYALNSEKPYSDSGTFPTDANKINNIPGVFNFQSPLLQHDTKRVADYISDDPSALRSSYYSAGAFKPWCGGWSFRKQALAIGKMPNRGYIYTNIMFKLDDLADKDSTNLNGINDGGAESQFGSNHLNTILYISCGALQDADATPNNPVTFYDDHYNSTTEEGESNSESSDVDLSQDDPSVTYFQGAFFPRTKKYNMDNFRPVSDSNLDPGDVPTNIGDQYEANLSLKGNTSYFNTDSTGTGGFRAADLVWDTDPTTNLDPKFNLLVLRIEKVTNTSGNIDYSLALTIGSHGVPSIYKLPLNFITYTSDSQEHISLFVYMSWDIVEEKITIGFSELEDGVRGNDTQWGNLSTREMDFTSGSDEYSNFAEYFQDKTLYDIGLGTSTYMNRAITGFANSIMDNKTFTMSGFHGFYGTTEMSTGDYITDKNQILSMRNGLPKYEIPVGVNWDDRSINNNISIETTKERVDKVYDNMVMWSELGADGFPDLNYKLVKEPVLKLMAAPSFLKFEYSNTFLIFTRNTINRFVLKGTASGWSGSAESLIEEQTQYGLFAPKSLVKVGADVFWLSEEGVVRWNAEGMQNISQNVIKIPLKETYLGFYCPMRNQYILHDNESYLSYAYNITYRMWTTFEGLNIISASILSRGDESENFNLLLSGATDPGDVNKYPADDYTADNAHIKTMDLFMDSGQIKRVYLNYNGNSDAKLIYNLAYNDKDSNNIERSNTITDIQKNTWRGLGDLGQLYGRVANFEVHDADEIFTILYDAYTRGGE